MFVDWTLDEGPLIGHWLEPKGSEKQKTLLETFMANSASKKKHKLHKPRSKLLKQSPAKCQKMSNTSVCECWTNVDSAEEFKHLLLWRNLLALQSRAVGFISPAPLSLLARSVSAFFGGTNLSMCVTLNPVPRINDLVNLRHCNYTEHCASACADSSGGVGVRWSQFKILWKCKDFSKGLTVCQGLPRLCYYLLGILVG